MGGGGNGNGGPLSSRFSGYTPLHYCAHYNAAGAAKVLTQYGAPIEMADLSDRFPIHVAVARGSSDVLRELLMAGAKVDREHHTDQHEQDGNHVMQSVQPDTPSHQTILHNTPPTQSALSSSLAQLPRIVTPVSSPVLKAMIPRHPVRSTKPWNCLSQRAIDECFYLIRAAEGHWSMRTHKFFSPVDRRAVLELLRVGKRLEQQGRPSGLFLELWPYILSFCGRGWFEQEGEDAKQNKSSSSSSSHRMIANATTTTTTLSNVALSSSTLEDDHDFTQFRLDD